MADGTQLVKATRSELVHTPGFAFFASRALGLELRADPSCDTAWTDGKTLGFNPDFMEGMRAGHRRTVVAHEVLHVANLHPWRRGGRDPKQWNRACDFVVNGILKANGFELPEGALYSPEYAGMSAEAVYSALRSSPPGEGEGEGGAEEGGTDPGGCGEVRDGATGEAGEEEAAAAQVGTLRACMQAKMRGELPAGLERLIARIKKPACRDLVAALLEFAAQSAREDYSWRRPNARYIAHGLYLPGLHSEQMGALAAAVDTSGSIDAETLEEYTGALQRVLDEARPEKLTVYCCDAKIQGEPREYLPGDEVSTGDYPGGGGTRFGPVFEAIAEGEPPACCVYLTDLLGRFPEEAPEVPTLWVVRDPTAARPVPPFGDVIYLDS